MIHEKELREYYVTPALRYYLGYKLPDLDAEEVDIRLEELLKYLTMAMFIEGQIPFSKEIDEMWHLWILETREYEILCKKINGGQFFHHTSNHYVAYRDPEIRTRKPDLNILASYVYNFGDLSARRVRYWTLAGRLMVEMQWDINDLNKWLHQCIAEGQIKSQARHSA